MSQMQSYRDLEIYRRAHSLAVKIHQLSLTLPKYELYETGSQIRRSSKSVAANIVEGFSRKAYRAEYIWFLLFAHGSCNETLEHLELLEETGSIKPELISKFKSDYEQLGGMLNRFIQAVRAG